MVQRVVVEEPARIQTGKDQAQGLLNSLFLTPSGLAVGTGIGRDASDGRFFSRFRKQARWKRIISGKSREGIRKDNRGRLARDTGGDIDLNLVLSFP